MGKVFLVDGRTRLSLPRTAWSDSLLCRLLWAGHRVTPVDLDPDSILRGQAEEDRAVKLMNQYADP